jgi:hypothetical protein
MALQLRRGTNAERLAITPVLGELIFVTDYSSAAVAPLFVGDGTTVGGNPVGASDLNFTEIEGNVTPDADSTRDLGTNSERWANAYVDDITVTNRVTGVVRGDVEKADGTVVFDAATGSITANITGSVSGSVVGHVIGSVFGDDSTQLVDGANANISNINNVNFNGGPNTGLNEVYQINVDSATNQLRIGHATDDEFGRLTFTRVKSVGTIPVNESVGRVLWTKTENGADTNFGVITCSQNQMVFSVDDGVHGFSKVLRVHKSGKVDVNGDLNVEPAADFLVNGVALLTPQTGAPASPTVGMIAVADGSTWDPAAKGGTPDPYPAFYDGNAWVAMA